MSVGRSLRRAFTHAVRITGQTVLIHHNFNKDDAKTFEARGLKNSPSKNSRQVIFQFLDQLDIPVGSVLLRIDRSGGIAPGRREKNLICRVKGSEEHFAELGSNAEYRAKGIEKLEAWLKRLQDERRRIQKEIEALTGPAAPGKKGLEYDLKDIAQAIIHAKENLRTARR